MQEAEKAAGRSREGSCCQWRGGEGEAVSLPLNTRLINRSDQPTMRPHSLSARGYHGLEGTPKRRYSINRVRRISNPKKTENDHSSTRPFLSSPSTRYNPSAASPQQQKRANAQRPAVLARSPQASLGSDGNSISGTASVSRTPRRRHLIIPPGCRCRREGFFFPWSS